MKKTLPFLLLLILAGCAVPYQPAGLMGGYSHQRLANDRFEVTYESPSVGIGEQRLRDLCLLRSAEIARDFQFDYFTIESDSFTIVTEPVGVNDVSSTKGVAEVKEDGKVVYESTTSNSRLVQSTQRTVITYEIRCYEEAPTYGNISSVYHANTTIEDVRYKYGLFEDSEMTAGNP